MCLYGNRASASRTTTSLLPVREGGGSFRQAELLFAGMADDEFAGFV
jgi:hypothetical protein